MKLPSLFLSLITGVFLSSPLTAQTLEPSWQFAYDETEAGQQIVSYAPISAASDGSVAFVVSRRNGNGGGLENRVFWLRATAEGGSPAVPLWTSPWLASNIFTDIIALRLNHLVYSSGRKMKSVVYDEVSKTATETVLKEFMGSEEGGDPLVFNIEQAQAPGFVFAIATKTNLEGFTFSAYRITPAPISISGVPTFTTINGENLSISFQTQPSSSYQLQTSTTLTTDSWQNLDQPVIGDGTIKTFLKPVGVPRLFFRVVIL